MSTTLTAALAAVVTMGASAASAAAQSAPTCSFDAATATVTVTVNGLIARVQANAASGEIRLNGVACAGATLTNTDLILVNGGALDDTATLTGTFAPGLTTEADASSKIEIVVALGGGDDRVTVYLTNGPDHLVFTAGGIDVGLDLDQDITLAGTNRVGIEGLAGDDIIDASAYAGPFDPIGRTLNLHGGNGNDRLIGDEDDTRLEGEAGNDILGGRGGSDWMVGGPGKDRMYGGSGGDFFDAGVVIDGADLMDGGSGEDWVLYEGRTSGVVVTIGNGLADDGEPGEGDQIESNIENLKGGNGDDVLIGTSNADAIYGGAGADEIWGSGGDDYLAGGQGVDSLVGEDGNDFLQGEEGPDSLVGEDGNDRLEGGSDSDVLTGGAGSDELRGDGGDDIFYNADGEADDVVCGVGTMDDAEPDPLDTFTSCEL